MTQRKIHLNQLEPGDRFHVYRDGKDQPDASYTVTKNNRVTLKFDNSWAQHCSLRKDELFSHMNADRITVEREGEHGIYYILQPYYEPEEIMTKTRLQYLDDIARTEILDFVYDDTGKYSYITGNEAIPIVRSGNHKIILVRRLGLYPNQIEIELHTLVEPSYSRPEGTVPRWLKRLKTGIELQDKDWHTRGFVSTYNEDKFHDDFDDRGFFDAIGREVCDILDTRTVDEIPPANYDGSSKRLQDFRDPSGQPIDGTAYRFGSVVLVTTKSTIGSYIYGKIYSIDGYLIRSLTRGRLNGKVNRAKELCRVLAHITDFSQYTELHRITQSQIAQRVNTVFSQNQLFEE